MRTVMIPSETKHSNTILWEQLWFPRKQSTAIQYYENSYDTLGNKAQQCHIMRTVMIPSETKHSIQYYENSYDTFRNKAQQYHTMRTVMIPSETKHIEYHTMRTVMIPSETKDSDTILWEQLWYPRKQSTAIPYYENSYDSLGNKAQRIPYYENSYDTLGNKAHQYHTMRTVMIPSETKHSS